jgi:hypothetical protein
VQFAPYHRIAGFSNVTVTNDHRRSVGRSILWQRRTANDGFHFTPPAPHLRQNQNKKRVSHGLFLDLLEPDVD